VLRHRAGSPAARLGARPFADSRRGRGRGGAPFGSHSLRRPPPMHFSVVLAADIGEFLSDPREIGMRLAERSSSPPKPRSLNADEDAREAGHQDDARLVPVGNANVHSQKAHDGKKSGYRHGRQVPRCESEHTGDEEAEHDERLLRPSLPNKLPDRIKHAGQGGRPTCHLVTHPTLTPRTNDPAPVW
jgi:hypothetical protein